MFCDEHMEGVRDVKNLQEPSKSTFGLLQ